MSTKAEIATQIINQIANASPEVIAAIKAAPISDDTKLAMLYFADPDFRAQIQAATAERLVALNAS